MMFHKILVAHDGSEGARKAFTAGLDLAARCAAELHMISVLEHHAHFASTMGEVMEETDEENKLYAEAQIESKALAAAKGVALQSRVISGHEVESIIRHAKDGGYDLLVVGFMGHSRVFGRSWGGTSQNLTKLAPCSVLVVK
jgi:nucleotide-binding universal stress UspA family protein